MDKSFIDYPSAWMTAVFFAMPRLLAIFSILPMFSKQALPGLLRVGVAFSIAIFVVPALVDQALTISRSGLLVLGILLKEVAIGFILGFVIALPIWAFEIMGAYVDNQRGASIAATVSPLTGHDSSPLGDLFSQAAVTFLLISGGYMLILGVIYDSFVLWRVFDWIPQFSSDTPSILLAQMDRLMSLAVLLSAPVIFAMFLAEFGLGLVSRFVPQLQVFFMAMPIKSALAMFVFAVYATTLFGYAADEFDSLGHIALSTLTSIFLQARP